MWGKWDAAWIKVGWIIYISNFSCCCQHGYTYTLYIYYINTHLYIRHTYIYKKANQLDFFRRHHRLTLIVGTTSTQPVCHAMGRGRSVLPKLRRLMVGSGLEGCPLYGGFRKWATWWLIPLSKWVITPVINGISRVNPLITGVITHLLSGMSHQVALWMDGNGKSENKKWKIWGKKSHRKPTFCWVSSWWITINGPRNLRDSPNHWN